MENGLTEVESVTECMDELANVYSNYIKSEQAEHDLMKAYE